LSSLLEVTDLEAGYGRSQVLQGVSLTVAEGEVVCLMGRNGVGKSTLLRTLMGVLPVRSGSVAFAGQDVTSWSGHRRARAGLSWLPQEGSVYEGLTVEEHLTLAARDGDVEGARTRAADLFPVLGERLRQEAQTLSGGERKMLGIAQAVVASPALLLLDEPTEGVAPTMVEQLRPVLAEVSRTCPVLLVEQNVDTALAIGTRAYVLEKGTVVEEGQVRALHDSGVLARRLGL
jgi:branched-chain amino acid transport system ATP-binding protein